MQRLTSTILAVCCLTFFLLWAAKDSATLPNRRVRQKEHVRGPGKPTCGRTKRLFIAIATSSMRSSSGAVSS